MPSKFEASGRRGHDAGMVERVDPRLPVRAPLLRLPLTLVLTTTVALSSGCATMMVQGPSPIDIQVEGPSQGATVTIRGVSNDEVIVRHDTHITIALDPVSSYAVFVVAPGYEPRLVRLRSEVHPAMYANLWAELIGVTGSFHVFDHWGPALFLGGVLISATGMLIDTSTKRGYRHEFQTLVVPMRRLDGAPASGPAHD